MLSAEDIKREIEDIDEPIFLSERSRRFYRWKGILEMKSKLNLCMIRIIMPNRVKNRTDYIVFKDTKINRLKAYLLIEDRYPGYFNSKEKYGRNNKRSIVLGGRKTIHLYSNAKGKFDVSLIEKHMMELEKKRKKDEEK